ncbi:hemin uptake protein HemP [Acidovorax sp. Be4]|uniref:Hemin uptake protein HemP n=1 Tax=Acidovorax bellezanensis TaxID=2976702 RepID=A0ABT2PSN1_9BURK|nr:hemin uptake protein HemP [Acidovorax sp. Be4]MCT9812794.1 hemin uptake protein HemP [Acidovorax sp. Be4]
MPATLTASSLPRTGLANNSPIQLAPLLAESALGMDSTDLLQGRKCVTILHNGMPYRLQATKLGKLILTK